MSNKKQCYLVASIWQAWPDMAKRLSHKRVVRKAQFGARVFLTLPQIVKRKANHDWQKYQSAYWQACKLAYAQTRMPYAYGILAHELGIAPVKAMPA